MTLTHSGIHLCPRFSKNVTIIDRCGEFSNVPLLGIRGESLTILVWNYDSLDMQEGMVLMIHLFKESSSTTRMMLRITAKGSCELGAWYIELIVRHWGTRIPSLLNLTSNGYELMLRVL